MPVARQWLNSHHVMAATDKHATIEELFEVVFSMQFVLRIYNKGQLPLQRSGLKPQMGALLQDGLANGTVGHNITLTLTLNFNQSESRVSRQSVESCSCEYEAGS
jgi:hypothetical protein